MYSERLDFLLFCSPSFLAKGTIHLSLLFVELFCSTLVRSRLFSLSLSRSALLVWLGGMGIEQNEEKPISLSYTHSSHPSLGSTNSRPLTPPLLLLSSLPPHTTPPFRTLPELSHSLSFCLLVPLPLLWFILSLLYILSLPGLPPCSGYRVESSNLNFCPQWVPSITKDCVCVCV